ncbi:hypothetical protein [Aquamicrobium defluvii]|uniref:hypothetical protein n=1 Tax=Aquamicrobium defluvii TaxID=69279 RepID=UPI00044EC147|nr:hypothetical protein [Aquamicrobium defluvii]EZQ14620.1 hypothetical protein CF98_19030 [Halopseudomonas bauzanensis]
MNYGGTVNLALDYVTLQGKEFSKTCVLTERLVTLSRFDRPGINEQLSLEPFLHLAARSDQPALQVAAMIRLALETHGSKRRIALTAPHLLSMLTTAQGVAVGSTVHFAAG